MEDGIPSWRLALLGWLGAPLALAFAATLAGSWGEPDVPARPPESLSEVRARLEAREAEVARLSAERDALAGERQQLLASLEGAEGVVQELQLALQQRTRCREAQPRFVPDRAALAEMIERVAAARQEQP